MVKKIDNILNDLIINKYKQSYIASIHNISSSYISTINKQLEHIKYKPYIINNKVVCLNCNIDNDLCIHHNHETGEPIAIICKKCNSKIKNKSIFKNGILTNNIYNNDNDLFNKNNIIQITIEDKLTEAVIQKWKQENPYDINSITHITRQIFLKYIKNDENEPKKK